MRPRVLVVDADARVAERRASELRELGLDAKAVVGTEGVAGVLVHETVDSILCSEPLRDEIERLYVEHPPLVPMKGESSMTLARVLSRLTRRSISPTVQRSLDAQLEDALASATMALEPIVNLSDGSTRAHRATLQTPVMPHEQLVALANELGRSVELRRAMRRVACEVVDRGDAARLMLECTIADLLDADLYNQFSPWGLRARAFMLTVNERDLFVLTKADTQDRLRSLRLTGFSFVARMGMEIAAPISTGVIIPSYALVDLASLGTMPATIRSVAAAVAACRRVGIQVLADVATREQARCAREAGCALAVGAGMDTGAVA